MLNDVRRNATADGRYRVDYSFANGCCFGRSYSSGKGYQALTRETRSFLSSPFYTEDDMVNSFPTILLRVFRTKGLPAPFLRTYVTNREQVFEDFSTTDTPRQALKQLFLASLHMGDYLPMNGGVPIPFLSSFQSEVRANAFALRNMPPFSSLHALAVSQRRRLPMGSMVAWVCQHEESMIAKTVFTECYLAVATNLFDGHLREKGDLDLEACSLICGICDRAQGDVLLQASLSHSPCPFLCALVPGPCFLCPVAHLQCGTRGALAHRALARAERP